MKYLLAALMLVLLVSPASAQVFCAPIKLQEKKLADHGYEIAGESRAGPEGSGYEHIKVLKFFNPTSGETQIWFVIKNSNGNSALDRLCFGVSYMEWSAPGRES